MQLMFIGAMRDHRRDAAFGEPALDPWRAVSLVAKQVCGRSALREQRFQQRLEEAALVPLAGRDKHLKRQATAIGQKVDL